MSVVFPFTSRWGSSVQHSHREHPGCRKTRGGVFQDEKCKDSTSQPLWNLLSIWSKITPASTVYWLFSHFLSLFALFQMFQVIQPERALYIQANNCVEARDWIDILTKVSQCNRKRLSTYHPSAYLNGHWLCCKLSADAAPGCTPCTGYVKFFSTCVQHHVPVPFCLLSHSSVCICFQRSPGKHPAGCRWRQRDWEDLFPVQHIHDQTDQDARSDTGKMHVYDSIISVFTFTFFPPCPVLSLYCPSLSTEACGSKSVYDGPEQEEYSSFVIDDPQETYKTLKQIVSAVQTLEQQHTKYKRDKFKKTKIGSQ